MWILWLQLTTTSVCPLGMPCAPPTVHTQQMPSVYRTRDTCETARERQQRAYATQKAIKTEGLQIMTVAKLWCAQGGQ